MEKLFKGTFITEEVQKEEKLDVLTECSNIKSESDLKSELAKAISISISRPSSMQAAKYLHL